MRGVTYRGRDKSEVMLQRGEVQADNYAFNTGCRLREKTVCLILDETQDTA
jgi:hypothetical protein